MAQPRTHGRKQSDPHWPVGDALFALVGTLMLIYGIAAVTAFLVDYLVQWLR